MKIKIIKDYVGAKPEGFQTKDNIITVSDDRAKYLITNGYAVPIVEAENRTTKELITTGENEKKDVRSKSDK